MLSSDFITLLLIQVSVKSGEGHNIKYQPSEEQIPKPNRFEAMIAAAQVLSKDVPFVRVDLYCIGETRIPFGEMTLYPEGGLIRFVPDSFDLSLGKLLTLPQP